MDRPHPTPDGVAPTTETEPARLVLARLAIAATGADVAAVLRRDPSGACVRVVGSIGLDPAAVGGSSGVAAAIEASAPFGWSPVHDGDPLFRDGLRGVAVHRVGAASSEPATWIVVGHRSHEPDPRVKATLQDLAAIAGEVATARDQEVDARSRAEESRAVLEAFAGGVLRLETIGTPGAEDVDFRIASVNRAAAAILGFTERDLVGWTMRERFPGEQIERFLDMHRCAIRHNAAQYVVESYRDARVDGTFGVHSVPVTGGVIVSFVDLTEQARTVERLRRRTDMLGTIGSLADVGGWACDPDGGSLSWSNEMYRLHEVPLNYRLDLDSALGFLRQSDAEAVAEHLHAGQAFDELVRYRTAAGERRWARMRGEPRTEAEGTMRWVGIFQDVTDEQQQIETNDQLRERLAAIVESIPVAVALKDTVGRYVMANGMARDLIAGGEDPVGRTNEELFAGGVGQSIAGLTDAEALERDVMHNGVGDTRTVTRTVGGATQTWNVSRQPYGDAAGRPVGVIVVARDVTEFETKRREAETANATKSAFLANMSHEIRSPMTSILGFTDLLIEESADLNAVDRDGYLQTIRRNGGNLLQLINDILDLSKIEAGALDIERRSVDVASLLEDVRSLMQVRAEERGVDLVLAVDGDSPRPVPRRITTDALRLRQIIVNLVGNAIKFTERGRVSVTVAAAGDGLLVRVRDTGIGMQPDQVAGLFQPFMQADVSTARRFGGTGLGLSISRRLAEALGGRIDVQSNPGEGSVFTVTVDAGATDGELGALGEVAPRADEVSSADNDVDTSLSGVHVLLADDGPDNRYLISHLLRKAGAMVDTANDGAEAIAAVRGADAVSRPYDVVLMDVQMPVTDGYEATRELRRGGWMGAIIALTADAMEGARDRALAAGCSGYASKPIDRAELLRLCARWARGHGPAASDASASQRTSGESARAA